MDSKELCEKVASLTNKEVILMFSRGKDSIGAYYQLKNYFDKIHLVYKYGVPDLQFVEDSLKYFEDKWQTKIHRLPSPSLYKQLNGFMWQTPESASTILQMGLPTHRNEDYDKLLPIDLKCPQAFRALGVRAADGHIRRHVIEKYSPINIKARHFYPIYDWTNDDLRKCFKDNDIKLPIDYEIWGKSFDGLDYRFIKPLKEHFPADYEQCKRFFPLIDLEILRYEQI